MSRGKAKEVGQVVKRLRKQGFHVSTTNGGHLKVQKGKDVVFAPATPSDHRAVKNMVAHLRRIGYVHHDGR